MGVAIDHGLRAPADPDHAVPIDSNREGVVVAHLAALADPIAVSESAIRFGLCDVRRDQAVGGAGGRIYDDADACGKGTHDQIAMVRAAACEYA